MVELERCDECGDTFEVLGYDQHHRTPLVRCSCCAPMPDSANVIPLHPPRTAAEDLSCAIETYGERLRATEEALREYADHQSWRCGHPDRYPWNPDCPCGLVSTLKRLGIPVDPPAA